ncbi:MAG TPA: hypothetical protein VLW85_01770 [Myxococcales bacterium]|nr:hypothetical protein [Myxococcales bacterium]
MKRCALLLLLCAACPAGLEEQSHISKLRVLGVRADPVELLLQADAGLPATTLSAITASPDGGAVTVRFALCTQITSAPDPSLDCPGDAGIDLPAVDALSARLDLSDPRIVAFAAAAQVDAGVFDAGGLAAALDDGVPLLVGFNAGDELRGFDTLTLRTDAHGPANANPQLLDVTVEGDPAAGAKVRLQPVTGPKDDPAKHYLFSFFATAGSMSSLHSTDTTSTGESAPTWVDWTAPSTPQTVQMWVVLRDGRGGIASLSRSVQVH